MHAVVSSCTRKLITKKPEAHQLACAPMLFRTTPGSKHFWQYDPRDDASTESAQRVPEVQKHVQQQQAGLDTGGNNQLDKHKKCPRPTARQQTRTRSVVALQAVVMSALWAQNNISACKHFSMTPGDLPTGLPNPTTPPQKASGHSRATAHQSACLPAAAASGAGACVWWRPLLLRCRDTVRLGSMWCGHRRTTCQSKAHTTSNCPLCRIADIYISQADH